MFKPVPPKPDFPAQEREVLQWWQATRAFHKLRDLRRGGPTFSFLDGPITANNPMGVHHAWGRSYKDLWQRYKAMRGFDQRWQNGFDCQGLWVEVNVEKDLGFKTKKDIEDYGLAQFVVLCKQRVLNFAAVQTEQSVRLGMWMDWNNPEALRFLSDKLASDPDAVLTLEGPHGPVSGTAEQLIGRLGLPEMGGSYFTFSDKNNYDIWRFLKACHENGWIYKGTDVMPWCWRCGTGISQHEIVTEGYIEKEDPGLTVRFPLLDRPGESLLVWTTTPWTLTSNVAAAVGPDLTYLRARTEDGEVLYVSSGATGMLQGRYEVLEELTGRQMEGWRYAGPFDDLPAAQQPGGWTEPGLRGLFSHIPENAREAHRVILWDEVGEAEGTGVVHIAPGCGAEDFQLHKQYNLPVLAPLDENGVYIDGFGWLAGEHVSEVTDRIVDALREKGRFYRLEGYFHRYPQCWRCQTPLVFRLVDEWFISMDGLRQPLMDISRQIRWIPDFGLERELDWLRNMHDWMISKKRYWGLALPIWECDDCGHFDVIGSADELEERAVDGWDEFAGHTPHRPYIDAVHIACSACGGRARRIADVGNPWLDAGIVSMSTMRYADDPEYWRKWFPADFITESFPGQFRNWFYSLLVMAAVLENTPPTRTVLGYSTMLAEDGRPMHKSWGNMIEFNEAADSMGADVMRWMFADQRYDSDMLFGHHGAKDTVKRFFLPLWNVYAFFVTYANLDGWRPGSETTGGRAGGELSLLDRWILARLAEVTETVTAVLDDYLAYRATRPLEAFLDDLSNWYVRRSRRRFWKSEADADKQAAYATLYQVLVTLSKLLAPMLPFLAETLYQNLVRSVDAQAPESVHHTRWPEAEAAALDRELLNDMAIARTVVTLGHATRANANLKVRQPLARAIVVVRPGQAEGLLRMRELVMDELNVKAVELAANEAELISYRLLPNNRLLGPRFGSRFPAVRAALAAADPAAAVATLRAGQALELAVDGEMVSLAGEDVIVNPVPKAGFAVAAEAGVVTALDTSLTLELRAEGLAREVVRRLQDLRKSAGFDIADRIVTYYTASQELGQALSTYADYIRAETLSVALRAEPAPEGAAVSSDSFDGETLMLGLVRAEPSDLDAAAAAALEAARVAGESMAATAQPPAARRAARKGASARKAAGKKSSAKKAALKKAAVRKAAAKQPAPRKASGNRAGAKRSPARKTAATNASVRKPPASKTAAKKSAARKAAVKRSQAKKSAAKKAVAKTATRKSAARRSAVKKTATKRSAAKKTTGR
jgi:isoleucyl-tRNA synthetase